MSAQDHSDLDRSSNKERQNVFTLVSILNSSERIIDLGRSEFSRCMWFEDYFTDLEIEMIKETIVALNNANTVAGLLAKSFSSKLES